MRKNMTGTTFLGFVVCSFWLIPGHLACCREVTVPVKYDTSVLDYSVPGKTERTYSLKSSGYATWTCTLKATIESQQQDPESKADEQELLALTLTYSGFDASSSDKGAETTLKNRVRAAGVETFEYRVAIDKYGNLVSSNLADQLSRLSDKNPQQRWFANNMLEPMVDGTWLCVFPKLGRNAYGKLAERDLRDWSAVGLPALEKSLAASETGAHLHIARSKDRRSELILWLNISELVGSVKYGLDRDITKTTRIELHYGLDRRAITKGTIYWHWTRTFREPGQEDRTQEETGLFEAVLKGQ